MTDLKVQPISGNLASDLVNPLYARNGSKHVSRDSDIFFVAFYKDLAIGSVRYCLEKNTHMLRSMMIDEAFRKQGVGSMLLGAFQHYVDTHGFQDIFCLPYQHLEKFYGSIGFRSIPPESTPKFLFERFQQYSTTGKKYLCMLRP